METAINGQTALSLKASLHPFTLLELRSVDLAEIIGDLEQRLAQAPELLKNAPVVIQLPKQPFDLAWAEQLIDNLRQLGFIPVGLRLEEKQNDLANHLKLPIFSESVQRQKAKPSPANPQQTMYVKTVRSGQQLVNANGDIVVLGNVGQGAEVLASGSIHIHGQLSGRALAGISGNANAVISCSKMQGELLAISGQYLVSDDMDSHYWQKPCYISLKDDALNIESI